MVINKKSKSGYTNKKANLIGMNIDIRTLNILCKYAICTNSYIRLSDMSRLNQLINQLDPEVFKNDIEKQHRIEFIAKALEARLKFNLTDPNMIYTHACDSLRFDINFIDPEHSSLNNNEATWCNNLICQSLKFGFVYDTADEIIDLLTQIKSTDFEHRGDLIDQYEEKMNFIHNNFRKTNVDNSLTDMTFSLRPKVFENAITDAYNIKKNPSRRLATGMQGLNSMIGGGFESGRVYGFFGITGVGKSLTLLNIIYQIKLNNTHYKTKDPTKTPCIVLLTMENSVVETITRLFDIVIRGSVGMEKYDSPEQVINLLRQEGQLYLNDKSPIDIVIKYKANRSVDTSYLYNLCEDLEDDNYEVICLVQDHIKRIRSIEGSPELRIELGDVVNEFKSFAIVKDIPVITNCHLNRDAVKIIEDEKAKSRPTDATSKLGKNNVGESMLIMDNIDYAIIINKVEIGADKSESKVDEVYMAFNLTKVRDKSDLGRFTQPFEVGSKIRLVEDIGFKEPAYKLEVLGSDIPKGSINQKTSSISSYNNQPVNQNNISSIASSADIPDNAFSSTSQYSLVQDDGEDTVLDNIVKTPNIITPIFFMKSKEDINEITSQIASTTDGIKSLLKSKAV